MVLFGNACIFCFVYIIQIKPAIYIYIERAEVFNVRDTLIDLFCFKEYCQLTKFNLTIYINISIYSYLLEIIIHIY